MLALGGEKLEVFRLEDGATEVAPRRWSICRFPYRYLVTT